MTQTTSLAFDNIKGGIPLGTICCFAARPALDEGPKSNMMSHLIYEAIRDGKQVLFLDMESTIDETYFRQLGLDNK